MKHSKYLKLAFVIGLVGLLAACAGPNTVVDTPSPKGGVAGFWSGLIHGFLGPLTFLISLISDNITMYEVHNNGGWYNFGFLIGIAIAIKTSEQGGGGSQT
jgi:hypothetical protein